MPCSIRQGDCFRFRDKESHLWIVLSDPEKDDREVLVVNATTDKVYKDRTYLLRAGAHPDITHDSCVNYPYARVYTAVHLESLLDRGIVYTRPSLTPEVFLRVWEGAVMTPHLDDPHRDILFAQGYKASTPTPPPAAPTTDSPSS